jgi:hypothetical protein
LRTARAALVWRCPPSTARCRIDPKSVSACLTATGPPPSARRSACQRAIASGVSSSRARGPSVWSRCARAGRDDHQPQGHRSCPRRPPPRATPDATSFAATVAEFLPAPRLRLIEPAGATPPPKRREMRLHASQPHGVLRRVSTTRHGAALNRSRNRLPLARGRRAPRSHR